MCLESVYISPAPQGTLAGSDPFLLRVCAARRCREMDEGLIPMFSLSKSKGISMKCPTCTDTPLVMAERQGVEIDYCPACRGIWLDRGELDKLLDRAAAASPVAPVAVQQVLQSAPPGMQRQQGYGDGRYGYSDRDHYKNKKSWLHDIFD